MSTATSGENMLHDPSRAASLSCRRPTRTSVSVNHLCAVKKKDVLLCPTSPHTPHRILFVGGGFPVEGPEAAEAEADMLWARRLSEMDGSKSGFAKNEDTG